MIQSSSRRSVLLSACLLFLALPAAHCFAQTKSTTPTPTPSTGTATPQGVTGSDPVPIKWPPSLSVRLGMQ